MGEIFGALFIVVGSIALAVWRYRKHRGREFMLARALGGGKAPCRWLVAWDKKTARQWARERLEAPDRWALLALSTAGPEPGDEVVEVCVMDPAGQVLLDSLLQPRNMAVRDRVMGAEAARLHGISDNMLITAPPAAEVLGKLAAALEGRGVIMHNVGFGLEMLEATCKRQQVACPVKEPDDLLAWEALSRAEWSPYDGHYALRPLTVQPRRARAACEEMQQHLRDMANEATDAT